MAVSVQTVVDQLNALLANDNYARFDATALLAAINSAIDESFPTVANVAVDSTITLDSSTYEYTPSATPELEEGFAVAYVTLDSAPMHLLRRVTQRQDGAAWTVRVPADVASDFSGETLYLQYRARVPRISSVSDTVELPLAYLEKTAAVWLADHALIKGANFETDPFERLIPKWSAQAARALAAARRGSLPQMIKPYTEHGRGAGPDRDEISAP